MSLLDEIEHKLMEEYNLVIRAIALPFYNDLFMDYIIGKNINANISIPTNLKINIKKKDIHSLSVHEQDYYDLSDKVIKTIQLENKINDFFLRTYGDKLNIYYDDRYYLHNYDLIKNFPQNSNLVYILMTSVPDSKKTNNLIKVVNKICDRFNINVDFEIYNIKRIDDFKINKNITDSDNVIIRFFGKIRGMSNYKLFYHYQKKVTELANILKCKNLIIDGISPPYTPKLTWDVLQNISQDFKKCRLLKTKYIYIHRRYAIILLERISNNNYVIKDNNMYRLYDNEYSDEYKNFMDDIITERNNRLTIFLGLFRMKEENKDYADMLLKKIDVYKKKYLIKKNYID